MVYNLILIMIIIICEQKCLNVKDYLVGMEEGKFLNSQNYSKEAYPLYCCLHIVGIYFLYVPKWPVAIIFKANFLNINITLYVAMLSSFEHDMVLIYAKISS